MSIKHALGDVVIITGDKMHNGEVGIIREIFKSRREPTIFNLEMAGRKHRMSFTADEFEATTPRARKTRSDAGKSREVSTCR